QVISISVGGSNASISPSNPSPTELSNRSGAPARISPTIFCGNHTARCWGSVTARQTFSGEWSSRRVNVSVHCSPSRASSPRSCSGRFIVGLLSTGGHRVEVPFERVEPVAPRSAVGREPLVDLAQGLGPQPVDAPLAGGPDVDHPRVPQDAEMLGDGGLADPEGRDQLADRPLRLAQQVEDAAAVGLGEHLEHAPEYSSAAI